MPSSTTIQGTAVGTNTPSDPSLCRVTGYLRDIHGAVIKGEKLVVRHIYWPVAVSSDTLVLNERQTVMSDSNGRVQFDLYRDARVRIELPNRSWDLAKDLVVPDVASIDLVALLFPYIVSVAWDDDTPITVSVDEAFVVGLIATMSDGTEQDVSSLATYVVGDGTVIGGSGPSFTGLKGGSTTIDVTAIDTDSMDTYKDNAGNVVERLDAPAISYPASLSVTVA